MNAASRGPEKEGGGSMATHRPGPTGQPTLARRAEYRLVQRVFERWHHPITGALVYSSIPAAFLGALTANESRGDPKAARFEPAVYRHLKAVASGQSSGYAGATIHRGDLEAEVEEMLHPKSGAFHAQVLVPGFASEYGAEIAALRDEALRELATSWGLTQVMGYHMVGRQGCCRNLIEPEFNLKITVELLSTFVERFNLDVTREFAELFRCWNTGQPYGKTFDPQYVPKGLSRMEMYREMMSSPSTGSGR